MSFAVLESDAADVYAFLIDLGCCRRCSLRFLGEKEFFANFENADQKMGDDNQDYKRTKLNPCVICLDLLQDDTLMNFISAPDLMEIIKYDDDTFVNFVSFPVAILLREHSIEIFLEENFEGWPTGFKITYTETSVIKGLCQDLEVKNKDILSRNFITELLKNVDNEKFKTYVPVPPQAANCCALLENIECKHEVISIAGRYCKYSRAIGQTPWVIDNVQIVENSVQQIMFDVLTKIFNTQDLIFSASGREDFDVRTLGRGRPFFIKICDPKITKISKKQFAAVEKEINKNNLIKIRDLQFIDKKDLIFIKKGEQFKRKTYRALCVVEKADNLDNYIAVMNNVGKLTLEQRTPLRVYHRRSADIRKRNIYKMKAKRVIGKDCMFELDVITQAGTYVKEFVHGDFGRTKPSLRELLGCNVDIIALDVLNIHLDFPPPLDR